MVNLKSHSDDYKRSVAVTIEIDGEYLFVKYKVEGNVELLALPACINDGFRQYDLWEHTCFELFLKRKSVNWYIEFNFAPSRAWNCFYLSSYRKNHGEYANVQEILIDQEKKSDCYELVAKISLFQLEAFDFKDITDLEVGLSAVIEEVDGSRNYWAINHFKEEPDFHDQKGFIHYQF